MKIGHDFLAISNPSQNYLKCLKQYRQFLIPIFLKHNKLPGFSMLYLNWYEKMNKKPCFKLLDTSYYTELYSRITGFNNNFTIHVESTKDIVRYKTSLF